MKLTLTRLMAAVMVVAIVAMVVVLRADAKYKERLEAERQAKAEAERAARAQAEEQTVDVIDTIAALHAMPECLLPEDRSGETFRRVSSAQEQRFGKVLPAGDSLLREAAGNVSGAEAACRQVAGWFGDTKMKNYLRQHPDVYAQQVRPRLLLLVRSANDDVAVGACNALIAAGDNPDGFADCLEDIYTAGTTENGAIKASVLLKKIGRKLPPLPDFSKIPFYTEDKPRKDDHNRPLPAGAAWRIEETRFRNPHRTGYMAFSPDGTMLADEDEGSIDIWSVRTGELLRKEPMPAGLGPCVLQWPADDTFVAIGRKKERPSRCDVVLEGGSREGSQVCEKLGFLGHFGYIAGTRPCRYRGPVGETHHLRRQIHEAAVEDRSSRGTGLGKALAVGRNHDRPVGLSPFLFSDGQVAGVLGPQRQGDGARLRRGRRQGGGRAFQSTIQATHRLPGRGQRADDDQKRQGGLLRYLRV